MSERNLENIAAQLSDLDRRLRRVETTDWPEVWRFIDEIILVGAVANVTFPNIPAQFRTLALFVQARTDLADEVDVVLWRANADAGNNYDRPYFDAAASGAHGSGGGRATSAGYATICDAFDSRADNWSPGIVYWIGYSLADREKFSMSPISTRIGDLSGDGDVELRNCTGHWRNTNAITSLTLLPETGPNFVAGSRFTLYGIL